MNRACGRVPGPRKLWDIVFRLRFSTASRVATVDVLGIPRRKKGLFHDAMGDHELGYLSQRSELNHRRQL